MTPADLIAHLRELAQSLGPGERLREYRILHKAANDLERAG